MEGGGRRTGDRLLGAALTRWVGIAIYVLCSVVVFLEESRGNLILRNCRPVNPAELFVWLGVAEGIRRLGLPLGDLAVRYIIVGLIVILIRGLLTQYITQFLARRQGVEL